jgi:nucleoid DNA-binding protein
MTIRAVKIRDSDKKSLITKVAKTASVSEKQAKLAVDVMIRNVATSPNPSDRIRISGLGTFELKKSPDLEGTVQISTGQMVPMTVIIAPSTGQIISHTVFRKPKAGVSRNRSSSFRSAKRFLKSRTHNLFIEFKSSDKSKGLSIKKKDSFLRNAEKLASRS